MIIELNRLLPFSVQKDLYHLYQQHNIFVWETLQYLDSMTTLMMMMPAILDLHTDPPAHLQHPFHNPKIYLVWKKSTTLHDIMKLFFGDWWRERDPKSGMRKNLTCYNSIQKSHPNITWVSGKSNFSSSLSSTCWTSTLNPASWKFIKLFIKLLVQQKWRSFLQSPLISKLLKNFCFIFYINCSSN